MQQLCRFILVFCICLCSGFITPAQEQQQKNDAVFELVKTYFNQKQADSMYALTGAAFREKISEVAFKGFTSQLFQIGSIRESERIKTENGVSSYKLVLTGATVMMSLGLDSAGKIRTFFVKPYTAPAADKDFIVASSNPMQTPLDRSVDSVVRRYIQKQNTVGLSVGILKDGKMKTYGYGSTEKGKTALPTDSSLFEIGSISKTFTSLLLAYYVTEGKLSLTDPITRYLPDSVAANPDLKNINLQMLSNHSSGLPRMPSNFLVVSRDPLNPYKDYGEDVLYAYLKNAALSKTPGQEFAYSNLGMALLGNILEHVTGLRYDQLVRQIITDPLGMHNTAEHLDPLQQARMAKVYNEKGEETPAWEFRVMAPAGSLRSTAKDLLVYAQAQLKPGNDQPGKAMQLTQQISFSNVTTAGLGWLVKVEEDQTIYTHSGGTQGSRSFLAFIPETNTAVVVLSNSEADVDETGVRLLEALAVTKFP